MAAVTKGNIYVWGIDTGVFSNAVLNSINFDEAFNNTGNVLDEDGNVIHERMADIHTTGTAQMVVSGVTGKDLDDTATADEFTYDGTTYYITEQSVSKSNGSFRTIDVSFEYIDYTTNAA